MSVKNKTECVETRLMNISAEKQGELLVLAWARVFIYVVSSVLNHSLLDWSGVCVAIDYISNKSSSANLEFDM